MNTGTQEYYVNNWLLDLPSGMIIHHKTGEKKRLGEYQLKLLDVLIQHMGQTLSREELTTLVWERRVIGNNSLPNAIHALRMALEDDGKQQRIIKTIPKKGYILEEEYCQRIEKPTESEQSAPDTEYVAATSSHSDDQDQNEHSSTINSYEVENSGNTGLVHHSPTLEKDVHLQRLAFLRSPAAILLLALLAISGWIAFFVNHSTIETSQMLVKEMQENVYSNVHLYHVVRAEDRVPPNSDRVINKLKDTLYQINQNLKASNVQMNMYYHTSDNALNYTMQLKNACKEQQLAMTVYHWRINNEQLNNLIYRETERKLNEMGSCAS